MPVIDFHFHAGRADGWYSSVLDLAQASLEEEAVGFINRVSSSTESLISYLDDCGIDYAVAVPEQSPVTSGVISNDEVAALCGGHPRLIPFCCINPGLVPSAAGELVRCVEDLGCRGLKLYPCYHLFYPNDPRIYPVYAKAEELGLPVMIHTGSSVFGGARLKYGDPIFVDDIATDFPDLKLLMCHGGRGFWYEAAFFLVRLHQNVYIDVAGLPPLKLLEYFPELERIADRLVFGSDWPAVPQPKRNIAQIRSLPIAEETKEKMLGKNAARLLAIE
ncbi:MAG: amidohydrolase [Chloroflexi bacterium]|nr:amidohydrolase [Chloroflexota bacterium]